MSDRELLELAAKAAGVSGGWGDQFKIDDAEVDLTDIWFLDAPETCAIWDPLEDDGDALRLAYKLGMQLDLDGVGSIEAVRRDIVRAAAACGRAMP